METTTKLSDLLDSPRAAKVLADAGFKTVGDLEGVAISELATLRGVGQRTLEQIGDVHSAPESDNFGEIEEGNHDIHLTSPRANYVIWVLRGDRVIDPERHTSRVMPPVLIQFKRGRGTITRRTYLMRKYLRDEAKIQDHINDGLAWRVECAEWLRSRQKHGFEYVLLSD